MILQKTCYIYIAINNILINKKDMLSDQDSHQANNNWIFSNELSFFSSKQELLKRMNDNPISQEEENSKFLPMKIQSLNDNYDIDLVYKLFNGLIFRCRFKEEQLKNEQESTFKKSIKQKQNQGILDSNFDQDYTNKIKKSLLNFNLKQIELNHWSQVLNHINMIEHIIEAKIFFKRYIWGLVFKETTEDMSLNLNIEDGNKFHVKKYVLAIDVLILIETMEHMFMPYSQKSLSKCEEFQRKVYQKKTEQLKQEIVQETYSQVFHNLKKITQNMPENSYIKIWIRIFQIKDKFFDKNIGIMASKLFEKKAQQYLKTLMNEWITIYMNNINSQIQNLSYETIYEEYCQLFHIYIENVQSQSKKIVQVEKYLTLISTFWNKMDSTSTSKVYIAEFIRMNQLQIKFHPAFLKKAKELIFEIKTKQLQNQRQNTQKTNKYKLSNFMITLTKQLFKLREEDDFTQCYIKANFNKIKVILKQAENSFQKIDKINNLINQLKEDTLIQVITKISELYKQNDIPEIMNTNDKINNQLNIIRQKYGIPEMMNANQNINHQLNIRQKHDFAKVLDQIKYFCFVAKCLIQPDQIEESEMKECCSYYQQQIKQKVNQKCIDPQNNTQINLLNSFRIVTFDLILKIKKNQKDDKIQKSIKLLFQLLKIFDQKQIQNQQDQDDIQKTQRKTQLVKMETALQMKRVKSINLNNNSYSISHLRQLLNQESQDFRFVSTDFIRKIYELRIDMISQNLKKLNKEEEPLKAEYININTNIYIFQNVLNHQEESAKIRELFEIQYFFKSDRFFPAWRKLKQYVNQKISLKNLKAHLQKIWGKNKSIIRIYVNLLIQYNQLKYQFRAKDKQIECQEHQQFVNKLIQHVKTKFNCQNIVRQESLKNAIKILDKNQQNIQLKKRLKDFQNLQKQKAEQREIMSRQFTQPKASKYTQLSFLRIRKAQKNIQTTKIYKITFKKHEQRQCETLNEKLKKLTKYNRQIQISNSDFMQRPQNLNQSEISLSMIINSVRKGFKTLPNLISYVIDKFISLTQFCRRQLNLEYILVDKTDFNILSRANMSEIDENNLQYNYWLQYDPYEGVLARLLLQQALTAVTYSKYPLIELANKLSQKFNQQKIYSYETAESYAYQHLIDELRCLSLEEGPNKTREAWNLAKKCPYFWSTTQKMFAIVDFKEPFQQCNDDQEKRRTQSVFLKKDLTEKPINTQYYCIIEGIIERAAFEQNICNYPYYPKNRVYYWYEPKQKNDTSKKQFLMLLDHIIKKLKLKQGENIKEHYPSFQDHLRKIRNILAHSVMNERTKTIMTPQQKMDMFQKCFPRFIVFIYKWRPYLQRTLPQNRQINIKWLNRLFPKDNSANSGYNLYQINKVKQLTDKSYSKKIDNNDYWNFWISKNNNNDNQCSLCRQIQQNILRKYQNIWQNLYLLWINGYLNRSHDNYNCFGMNFLKERWQCMVYRMPYKRSQLQFELKKKLQIKKFKDQLCTNKNAFNSNAISKQFMFLFEYQCPTIFQDIRRNQYQWDSSITQ